MQDPEVELDEDKDGVAVDEGASPCEMDDMRTVIRDSAGEGI